MSLHVSLCLLISLSMSMYVSPYLCVFLRLSVSLFALPISFSVLSLSLYLFVSLSLSRSISRSRSLCSSLSLFHFQSLSLSAVRIPTRERNRFYMIFFYYRSWNHDLNNISWLWVYLNIFCTFKKNTALLYFSVHDLRNTSDERFLWEKYSFKRWSLTNEIYISLEKKKKSFRRKEIRALKRLSLLLSFTIS